MSCQGSPFKAHVHSTDASSGVAVPIYRNGEDSVYTLADNEYLEVHSINLITAAGGDCYVNIGDASAVDAGEIVVRGTYAVNGGVAQTPITPPVVGQKGHTLWVHAPVGVVDVTVNGTIRAEGTAGVRPSWREDATHANLLNPNAGT